MGEKKEQCRFTLQFCATDPRHQKVVKILNQQGRRKAQYLVDAVLNYENGMVRNFSGEQKPTDYGTLETIVNQILGEKLGTLHRPEKPVIPSAKVETCKTEEITSDDGLLETSKDGLAAITNSIAAFRSK